MINDLLNTILIITNSYQFFDGSESIIEQLKSLIYNSEILDQNRICVLAIDAASITPQISINNEGIVNGFTDD